MKKLLLTCSCLLLAGSAFNSNAAIIWWDPNGTTSVGGNGTWNTTTAEWSTATTQSASLVAWNSADAAGFCAGPSGSTSQGTFTISVTNAVNFAGLYNGSQAPGPCTVTFSGSGSLNLAAGAQGFSTHNSSVGFTKILVPITGSGQISAQDTGQLYLEATNTYTGGTGLGFSTISYGGIINFNNSASFGTGGILMVNGSTGALVADTTSAVTIPNGFTNQMTGQVLLNIVGNANGVTFTGPWKLTPASATTDNFHLSSGGSAANIIKIGGVISGTNGFTKYGVGMLALTAANTYGANSVLGTTIVSNGMLIIANTSGSGTGVSPVVVTNSGATAPGVLTGSGSITGTVTIMTNGDISATNLSGGCANLTTGAETWNAGSTYVWGINNANGTAGASSGWDTLTINGALNLSSTWTLALTSLTAANKQGAMAAANFNSASNYSWPILTATNGITGFDSNNVTINTSKFGNSLGSGHFYLTVSGNTMYLAFGGPPTATISPAIFNVGAGKTAYINTHTTGSQLTYTWTLNGNPITSPDVATNNGGASLAISPAQDLDAGTYTVVVSNPVGSVTNSSLLIVTDPVVYNAADPNNGGNPSLTLKYSGPAGQGYRIWSSTDPTLPVLGGWNYIGGGNFSGGQDSFIDTIPIYQQEYYTITVP